MAIEVLDALIFSCISKVSTAKSIYLQPLITNIIRRIHELDQALNGENNDEDRYLKAAFLFDSALHFYRNGSIMILDDDQRKAAKFMYDSLKETHDVVMDELGVFY